MNAINSIYFNSQLGEVAPGTCINICALEADDRNFVLRSVAAELAQVAGNADLEEPALFAYLTRSVTVKQVMQSKVVETDTVSFYVKANKEYNAEQLLEVLADIEKPGALKYVFIEDIDQYFIEDNLTTHIRGLRRAAANGEFILVTTSGMRPDAQTLKHHMCLEEDKFLETVANGSYSLRGLDMEYDAVIFTTPDELQLTDGDVHTHNAVIKHRAVDSKAGTVSKSAFVLT